MATGKNMGVANFCFISRFIFASAIDFGEMAVLNRKSAIINKNSTLRFMNKINGLALVCPVVGN